MSKKIKTVLVSAISFIVLAVIGGVLWYQLYYYVRTNDAIIDGFSVNISSDILGRITTLFVDEGDYVKKGQLLCQIDDTILISQRIESEAQIATLEQEVAFQDIFLKKVADDYYRAEKAFIEHVISAQDFDHAQKDFEMAKKQFLIAKAKLEQARARLGVILAQLEHTLIFSPRDGVIAKRWHLSGDVVNPGLPVFSLYDLKDVWVLANLDENDIEHVKVGDPVAIHVDAYSGRTFHGKVFAVLGAAASQFSLIPQDNATGNYTKVAQRVPVKISISSEERAEDLYLFPGLSVEVKIQVRTP